MSLWPTNATSPFGGGIFHCLRRLTIESIAPITCFRVLALLMFELCEYSPRREFVTSKIGRLGGTYTETSSVPRPCACSISSRARRKRYLSILDIFAFSFGMIGETKVPPLHEGFPPEVRRSPQSRESISDRRGFARGWLWSGSSSPSAGPSSSPAMETPNTSHALRDFFPISHETESC